MWHDFRLEKPDCGSYQEYFVVEKHNSIARLAACAWVPTHGYTDGVWKNLACEKSHIKADMTNNDVLYWMDIPKMPALV